jgi:hypothetical protein
MHKYDAKKEANRSTETLLNIVSETIRELPEGVPATFTNVYENLRRAEEIDRMNGSLHTKMTDWAKAVRLYLQ